MPVQCLTNSLYFFLSEIVCSVPKYYTTRSLGSPTGSQRNSTFPASSQILNLKSSQINSSSKVLEKILVWCTSLRNTLCKIFWSGQILFKEELHPSASLKQFSSILSVSDHSQRRNSKIFIEALHICKLFLSQIFMQLCIFASCKLFLSLANLILHLWNYFVSCKLFLSDWDPSQTELKNIHATLHICILQTIFVSCK